MHLYPGVSDHKRASVNDILHQSDALQFKLILRYVITEIIFFMENINNTPFIGVVFLQADKLNEF